MNRLLPLCCALLATSLLGACTPSLKSYADGSYRKASAQQLTALTPPLPVRVEVQFQQQGKPKPTSDLRLRGHVERALAASSVLSPDQMSTAVLRVVVNNVGDKSEAMSAGIRTGLSFGLSGAVVDDEYQFNIDYTDAAGKKSEVFFRHVMHTAVGGAELPAGIQSSSPGEAFGQIVQDAVMAALQQLQQADALGRAS